MSIATPVDGKMAVSGARIRYRREHVARLTLAEMAVIVSQWLGRRVDVGTLSAIEAGQRMPGLGILETIADVLDCRVDKLIRLR